LVAWVRNYVGDELLWDVNLILKKEEVPPLVLGEGSQTGLDHLA
jgi:type VI secretion system protein ImpH